MDEDDQFGGCVVPFDDALCGGGQAGSGLTVVDDHPHTPVVLRAGDHGHVVVAGANDAAHQADLGWFSSLLDVVLVGDGEAAPSQSKDRDTRASFFAQEQAPATKASAV